MMVDKKETENTETSVMPVRKVLKRLDMAKYYDEVDNMKVSSTIWKSKIKGDTIGGDVTARKDNIKSRYKDQEPYSLLTLQTDEGLLGVIMGTISQREFIEEANPQPGNHVIIQYRGKSPTAEGNNVKHYACKCIKNK